MTAALAVVATRAAVGAKDIPANMLTAAGVAMVAAGVVVIASVAMRAPAVAIAAAAVLELLLWLPLLPCGHLLL